MCSSTGPMHYRYRSKIMFFFQMGCVEHHLRPCTHHTYTQHRSSHRFPGQHRRSVYHTDTIRCVFLRQIIRFGADRKRTVLKLYIAVNTRFSIVNDAVLIDLGRVLYFRGKKEQKWYVIFLVLIYVVEQKTMLIVQVAAIHNRFIFDFFFYFSSNNRKKVESCSYKCLLL